MVWRSESSESSKMLSNKITVIVVSIIKSILTPSLRTKIVSHGVEAIDKNQGAPEIWL